jgi:hypothetical protein
MKGSYGVVWREGTNSLARGKLELLARALRLDGLLGTVPITREVPYAELASVRVGRASADRLGGQPTLLLEQRTGVAISLAAVAQPGAVAELAERLARLIA